MDGDTRVFDDEFDYEGLDKLFADFDPEELNKLFDDCDTAALDKFLSEVDPFEACSFDELMEMWDVEPSDILAMLDGVNTEEELRRMVNAMDGKDRVRLVLDVSEKKCERILDEMFRKLEE